MVYPRNYPEEHLVVKNAEYFDEVRRAVAWTSPIALFGTSGLAVYQRIESAQDFELRAQLSPKVYSRYRFQIEVLRVVTAIIPWLSILLTLISIMSLGLTAKDISGLHVYALIAIVLIVEFLYFLTAKLIQVALWRLGSKAIRYWSGVSGNSRLDDASSESDAPD
jgi:apolipoprotein N-acyltransferase